MKCEKAPPPFWTGASPCIREAGHGPKLFDRGVTPVWKRKRKPGLVRGTEHRTSDGRVWPGGSGGAINAEYA